MKIVTIIGARPQFIKAPRYDIKGRRLLEFSDKLFLNDIGLRHGLIGYRERDVSGLLENTAMSSISFWNEEEKIGALSLFFP